MTAEKLRNGRKVKNIEEKKPQRKYIEKNNMTIQKQRQEREESSRMIIMIKMIIDR